MQCMQELEKKLKEPSNNKPTSATCKQPRLPGATEAGMPSVEPANTPPFPQTVATDREFGAAGYYADDVQAMGSTPEAQDDSLRDSIRRCLLDPGFAAYVDRVEALWEEMEHEMLEEMVL